MVRLSLALECLRPPFLPLLSTCRRIPIYSRPAHVGRSEAQEASASLPGLEAIRSLLRDHIWTWCESLSDHPDVHFVDYVLDGIQHGFQVSFNYTSPLRSAQQNMLSVLNHTDVVDEYVRGELTAGRIIGPMAVRRQAGARVEPAFT